MNKTNPLLAVLVVILFAYFCYAYTKIRRLEANAEDIREFFNEAVFQTRCSVLDVSDPEEYKRLRCEDASCDPKGRW